MNCEELKLECLRAAVEIWSSLESGTTINETGEEVLEVAKSFYSWIVD